MLLSGTPWKRRTLVRHGIKDRTGFRTEATENTERTQREHGENTEICIQAAQETRLGTQNFNSV